MKTIILSLMLLAIPIGLYSQDFKVPQNYNLVLAEDYAPYEQDIMDCIDWLMKTPVNEQTAKRKEANEFLLKWLMGSPYVHIYIKQEIVTFMGTSPELLMMFMGGWAKYSLETRNYDNRIEGSKAGIEAVIEFYNENRKNLQRNKNVEKYIKMKKKGTLDEYIEKNA